MSLLTDSSAVALATDPSSVTQTILQSSNGKSSLPTAIFPNSATKVADNDHDDSKKSKITSSPTSITSSFYSNLEILTDTSSIAALASSDSAGDDGINSASISSSNGSKGSTSGSGSGALDEDSSGSSGSSEDSSGSSSGSGSSSVASVSKSNTSKGNSIIYHQHQHKKLNWKFITIPMMLVLPLVL